MNCSRVKRCCCLESQVTADLSSTSAGTNADVFELDDQDGCKNKKYGDRRQGYGSTARDEKSAIRRG